MSWYTFLEQGRDVKPSRAVLDSLATVLRMSEDERRYVHGLARGAESGSQLSTPEQAIVLVRQILALWEYSPYPVYSCDRYCNLVGWNRAAGEWYGDWTVLPDEDRNLLVWMLTSPEAKHHLVDWEVFVRDILARWRSDRSRYPDDPTYIQLTQRLLELSPEFEALWNSHEVLEHRSGTRRFRHGPLGETELQVVPLLSPEMGDCGILLHLPLTTG